jgi:DNA (cytosine-5)-methyltransferase 1
MSYKWNLSDGYPDKNELKVFSCFACGGGSTMGYKKAGYTVLGCNEIDHKIASVYNLNHKPKYIFVAPIQEFCKREMSDYPNDLLNLDILDGSPPCSSFSMAGNREKDWGKEKMFKEGQAEQVLDTLFWDFIELANKLRPKVIISENVKGLLMGDAKEYFHKIMSSFDEAGYESNHYLLEGSDMGLPQKRERVFILSVRKDICQILNSGGGFPYIDMNFYEKKITFEEATREFWNLPRKKLTKVGERFWPLCEEGKSFSSIPESNGSYFNWIKMARNKPAPTLTAHSEVLFHPIIPGTLNEMEYKVLGSYPLDYKVTDDVDVKYLIGMSVPPLMIQKIAERVKEFIFDNLK